MYRTLAYLTLYRRFVMNMAFSMGVVERLPEDVVRKIAAGEVIVRPANAVKELVENSLDAGATEIVVSIKEGGLALLQVKDNGSGIWKDDMELVCERFATSKLRRVEELARMTTYGFRGEALASIAMVASINVSSKREEQECAYQVNYKEGGMDGRVRPAAGGKGTTVTVEGLFSASAARRRALKNTNEEAGRVIDLIARYAVHRPDVSFVVRRDERGCDLRTTGDGDRKRTVAVLHGEQVAKDAVTLSLTDPSLYFEMEGLMSKPYSTHSAQSKDSKKKRQRQFVLFINSRPVTCSPLKSTVETTLGARALATTFILISIKMEPSRVDVNVHPTKESVFFLQQDDVIQRIQTYLDEVLSSQLESERPLSMSRPSQTLDFTFTKPPGDQPSTNRASLSQQGASKKGKQEARCDYKMVRVSGSERRLEEFFLSAHSAAHSKVTIVPFPQSQDDVKFVQSSTGLCSRSFSLSSLSSLRSRISSSPSPSLSSLFRSFFFVGCPSPESVLLQFNTSLLMVRLRPLLEELFYQMTVFSFGNLGSYRLSPPLPLLPLLRSAAPNYNESSLREAAAFLLSKSDMLNDYFSLSFEERDGGEGKEIVIATIPSLVHGHRPQMTALPDFLLCLLVNVDWDDEENCLDGIARSIAAFYAVHERWTSGQFYERGGKLKWRSVIADLLLPNVKRRLIPPLAWEDNGMVREMTTLKQLYKVFERC